MIEQINISCSDFAATCLERVEKIASSLRKICTELKCLLVTFDSSFYMPTVLKKVRRLITLTKRKERHFKNLFTNLQMELLFTPERSALTNLLFFHKML
jgi:hypothetical protein